MSVFTYATVDELEAWIQADVPDNADLLIRSASQFVGRAIRGAKYDVDVDGKASDATNLEALSDATCAQVSFWISAGIDPLAGDVQTTQLPTSSAILSGSVSYDTSQAGAITRARMAGAQELCPDALSILDDIGLLRGFTTVYG